MAQLEAILDAQSMRVIEFLRRHPCVVGVDYVRRVPAPASAVAAWHESHQPCVLPTDLIEFYRMTDGLLIKWRAKHFGRPVSLGCMHVNPLRNLKPVPMEDFVSSDGEARGFELDTANTAGIVALVYRGGSSENPEVWFQDLSCAWNLVARSFTEYFRVMLHHLGLPSWQYAFTDAGLDPLTKEWFRLLHPERLRIDDWRLSSEAEGPEEVARVGGVRLSALPAPRAVAAEELSRVGILDAAARTAADSPSRLAARPRARRTLQVGTAGVGPAPPHALAASRDRRRRRQRGRGERARAAAAPAAGAGVGAGALPGGGGSDGVESGGEGAHGGRRGRALEFSLIELDKAVASGEPPPGGGEAGPAGHGGDGLDPAAAAEGARDDTSSAGSGASRMRGSRHRPASAAPAASSRRMASVAAAYGSGRRARDPSPAVRSARAAARSSTRQASRNSTPRSGAAAGREGPSLRRGRPPSAPAYR